MTQYVGLALANGGSVIINPALVAAIEAHGNGSIIHLAVPTSGGDHLTYIAAGTPKEVMKSLGL
ncbi:hypothetical protein GHK50_21040 [Sinorhizobium medicae]|uniref:Uncharacterized protein n=1 Tax=Sinorhizobium medicae TaxID=110321 RepID=A0A6G1WUM4_9HYPH|nr:hypothetical protein [Sinorhizobium medicae]MQW73458.1 hypothetical protein [Sinorhizobium medicae]MQX85553.1 hypothetical protein [Sinorhizobium medicae]